MYSVPRSTPSTAYAAKVVGEKRRAANVKRVRGDGPRLRVEGVIIMCVAIAD